MKKLMIVAALLVLAGIAHAEKLVLVPDDFTGDFAQREAANKFGNTTVNGTLDVSDTATFTNRVGVGTTAPDYMVHVVKNGTDNATIMADEPGGAKVGAGRRLLLRQYGCVYLACFEPCCRRGSALDNRT